MKYECEICHYIYDSDEGDPKFGFKRGIPLEDLPDDWVCPICGIEKEYFHPVGNMDINPKGEAPLALMVFALTRGLWTISGRGSYSVTREIGKTFLKELESGEMDLNGEENALESVRKYFIDQHKFALDMDYEVKEDEVELIVKNCRFFSICKQLESQNILITTCPYTNTSAMALEKVTGYRYRISKEQKGYGHHITLKKLSQVKNV